MTQEDKQLLLKDLCARLPYKPIVHAKWSYRETNGELKHKEADRKLEINDMYAIWDIKPYLRPMSSMTEVEKHKLLKFGAITCLKNGEVIDVSCVGFERHADVQDYLNSIHIDYRGLIEQGLAIEVTKENNPYKK